MNKALIDALRVMTANLAHGSKDGMNQNLIQASTIKSNLRDVGNVIAEAGVDIVALQEADGPSIWSGNFDHVRSLAKYADFKYSAHGYHVDGLNLSYGTALLSRYPLKQSFSFTFSPSPPTFSKGFVIATVPWPCTQTKQTDIISLHLDFSRNSIRKKQVKKLIQVLKERRNSLIVMGDFNTDWKAENSVLQDIQKELNLKIYLPESEELISFPFTGKRLDWILISNDLSFKSYQVLPDIVSDHLMVRADITSNSSCRL